MRETRYYWPGTVNQVNFANFSIWANYNDVGLAL